MGAPDDPDRYHALDALRAAMMLAVVALHAALPYSGVAAGRTVFKFADPDRGPEFFAAALLLQAVSMPAFFLAGGFFATKLVAGRGPRAMLANRLRRVALPLLAFWPVLFALTASAILYGCLVADEVTVTSLDDAGAVMRNAGWRLAADEPYGVALEPRWPRVEDTLEAAGTFDGSAAGRPVFTLRGPALPPGDAAWAAARFAPVGLALPFRPSTQHLVHLWFLWVLTLLCLVAAAVAPVAARCPTGWLGRRMGGFAFPLVAAVPFAVVFAAHDLPAIPNPPTLAVPPATVFGYGMFFAVGALLWRHRDQLGGVGRWWPVHLAAGVAALGGGWELAAGGPRAAVYLLAAVGHWQLVWAALGLFNRFTARRHGWLRYLADASYWVYLAHLPVVLWAAAVLLTWPASRFVKFPIVLGVGLAVPLASYALVVRRTALGRFLNGPR